MSTGTTRRRQPPLWLKGGRRPITDSFKRDPRCGCIGKRDLYFDDSMEALAVAQSICARCPLFQDCTRWTLDNLDGLEYGIFAGLTPHVRSKIADGEPYYDWRREWSRAHYARKLVRARGRKYPLGTTSRRRAVPVCVYCGSDASVWRNGRNAARTHQRYRCADCRKGFIGEEL